MFAKPLLERKGLYFPMRLQFFAEGAGEDDPEDDDLEGGDPEDDELNLDELLKDPKFKAQYQAKFKEQLAKRMKKYKDIDPEEYRRLKEQADKAKGRQREEDDDETESLKKDLADKEKKIQQAERREKRVAVKEYAVDNGYNPKLVARLIDIDKLELDEDGEIVDIDEIMDELIEEFPDLFKQGEDQDDGDEEEELDKKRKKSGSYRPGSSQKGNGGRKEDKRAKGAQRALQRHKKEEGK